MTSLVSPFTAPAAPPAPVLPSLAPAVSGHVRLILRAEGLAILMAAVALYARAGHPGWLFATLFLVPDLSLFGYLAGSRLGAITYNSAHSLLGPVALALAALFVVPALGPYALIWLAHVGFDRALGYGLKYRAGFVHTHLGRIGRAAERS